MNKEFISIKGKNTLIQKNCCIFAKVMTYALQLCE